MKLTRTSEEWCRILGYEVLDPDGWDRCNFERSWSRRIDEQEFRHRLALSTVRKVAPAPMDEHDATNAAIASLGLDPIAQRDAVVNASRNLRAIEMAGVSPDSDVWINAMHVLRDAVDRMPVIFDIDNRPTGEIPADTIYASDGTRYACGGAM